MVEVEVRNFQSIEHATVKIDGFTTLVGRSNIGKSAFVRAVKAALTGAPVSSQVRHGVTCQRALRGVKTCSCFASVRIKTTGFDLLWEKGDTVNRYEFNGTTYEKVDKGVPDFLQQYVAPVKVGESKELLQVSDQFTPIFLLDQTGTVVADVLSDVAHLDRINIAMRSSERDRREAIATRKVREKDTIELEGELGTYDGLDDVVDRAKAIETAYDGVQMAQGRAAQLGCYIRAVALQEADIKALEATCGWSVPAIDPVLDQWQTQDKLQRFYMQFAERAVVIRALNGVGAVQIPSLVPLQEAAKRLGQLGAWTTTLFEFQRWFDTRKAAEKAKVPAIGVLVSAAAKFDKLNTMTDSCSVLARTVASLDAELKKTEQMEAEILDEFRSLGVCPTCAQDIHPDGGRCQ